VAPPPQLLAIQAAAFSAELAESSVSAQALGFYRIPLFLLPIYQAAAVRYGVPWQILAAINEIETDYGNDLSVSSAGAVGWMQFMPATWIQYGVDALNAGYADPYNPVDAVFAAARYLRAAGAATNLRAAILAYNHSDEYLNSVLLRAKLISSYPKSAIASLTGLIDARLPVTGPKISWGGPVPSLPSSSATANATAIPGGASAAGAGASAPATPGRSTAPSPAAAAAGVSGAAGGQPEAPRLVELVSARNASVVAVQDGAIVQLGSSPQLGRYVILRDVYGDVYTYAGLGSIARTYRPAGAAAAATSKPQAGAPAPQGKFGGAPLAGGLQEFPSAELAEPLPPGMGKVRLYAHPGNPDARAAAGAARKAAAGAEAGGGARSSARRLPLRRGSIVAAGTVLGRVHVGPGGAGGRLRFAIRPSGDSGTIDPRAVLANWRQLGDALHPVGARGASPLAGATASGAFLLTKSQLEREILSDPGIDMSPCSRHQVASGTIDKRVLAVLAFLSRSGLKPAVKALRCGAPANAISGYVSAGHIGDAVAISQINGISVAGHQGPGSITDTTIRTLLTLRGEFAPRQIVGLTAYPGAASTLARADHGDYIEIDFPPSSRASALAATARTAAGAHSAGHGGAAPAPLVAGGELSPSAWDRLITRIAGLPVPTVSVNPSSSAIPDPASPRAPGSGARG
jgi:hypothetical protein